MKRPTATLVGDGIENPGNALTMLHAAEMYLAHCRSHDTNGLAESAELKDAAPQHFRSMTAEQVRSAHPEVGAFDNLPGADQAYGFRPTQDSAVAVGNERRGLSHQFREAATHSVEIPMISRNQDRGRGVA